jgi:hypothetical protein
MTEKPLPSKEECENAIKVCDTFVKAASFLQINVRQLEYLRKKYEIAKEVQISNETLVEEIIKFAAINPACGEKMRIGYLRGKGIKVTRRRHRQVVQTHDADNHAIRCQRKQKRITRRAYSSPGVNFAWHMDGWHKLVAYGFVVHGCIDGFSRFLIFLHASTNNKSSTVARLFHDAVYEYGCPAHVRIDKGGENFRVAIMQSMMRDIDTVKSVIVGKSTHNQKIERSWQDTREFCLDSYINLFHLLEGEELEDGTPYLDVDNKTHKYVLQYLFLNAINENLNRYVRMWNNHRLRLPKESICIDPDTHNLIKSIIPKTVYDTYPNNFSKYGLLDPFHDDEDLHNYLFYHNTNEEYELVEVDEGLWELDHDLLEIFHETFEPLTLESDYEECYEIYKLAIDFITYF